MEQNYQTSYGGLNKVSPQCETPDYLVPSWWCYPQRNYVTGGGFWELKALLSLQLLPASCCSKGCEIPATSCSSHHACCLLPCLPIMTDPYPSGTISLNKILSSTSCSGRGSTGRSTHCFCGGPWSSGLSTHAGWLTTPVTPASGDPLASSHP